MIGISQRYISNELTHFLGRGLETDEKQYELLLKILTSGWITHPPHTPVVSGNILINEIAKTSQNQMYSPQVVCLCDIPIYDMGIHIKKYSPFGLSFSKDFIVKKGGSPVFYIPKSSFVRTFSEIVTKHPESHIKEWEVTASKRTNSDKGEHFDGMLREYSEIFEAIRKWLVEHYGEKGIPDFLNRFFSLNMFFDFHIFSFLKFFDHTRSESDTENFYFEREWRIVGNLSFEKEDVKTIIIPKEYAKHFKKDCPEFCGQIIFSQ